MEKRKIIITAVGLGVLASSFLISKWIESMAEAPKKMPPKAVVKVVKTVPVSYGDVATEVVAYGRVHTAQTLDMISEVSGRMMQGAVPLKEGQSFKKGTLLFKVDDEESRLNLQSQKSVFLKDLAAILPDLKVDFPKSYPAWQQYFNSINIERALPSLPEYKSSQEKTFLATRNILSSFYSIKSQESRLRKHNFYAPFTGSIYSVNLHSGSFVNPGSNIARLIRSDKQELKVDVSATDIYWIEKGETARIYSEDGGSWTGVITRVGEFVNQNTQSVDVFVAINKNDHQLYDGQFLRAVIPSRKIPDSMVIPRNIVFNQDEVFVVNDSVLSIQKIKIHKINEETIVMDGIPAGTDLVYEPLVNAFNGMVVTKQEMKPRDIEREPQGAVMNENSISN